MSTSQPPAVSAGQSSRAPKWDPRDKYFQTRLRFTILLALVLALTLFVFYWVAVQTIAPAEVKPLPVGANLTVILAPVLAAAAGIERFLETIFCVIEGNWRTLVAYMGRGMRWLHNAELEVEGARQWLANISAEYSRQLKDLPMSSAPAQPGQPVPQQEPKNVFTVANEKLESAKKLMDLAEKRLQTAEAQLSQVTASSGYRNAKRAASIYLGLLLGLIVATASSLQMFALMGVKVGDPRIDVIVTGFVIGSGSAPVHSLINILQSAKDTLDSAQGWLDAAKKKPTA